MLIDLSCLRCGRSVWLTWSDDLDAVASDRPKRKARGIQYIALVTRTAMALKWTAAPEPTASGGLVRDIMIPRHLVRQSPAAFGRLAFGCIWWQNMGMQADGDLDLRTHRSSGPRALVREVHRGTGP
jgi:hypothetical protein